MAFAAELESQADALEQTSQPKVTQMQVQQGPPTTHDGDKKKP